LPEAVTLPDAGAPVVLEEELEGGSVAARAMDREMAETTAIESHRRGAFRSIV
jgi:hypothetical protein